MNNILPQRRKRSDSFFGLHYDFHATERSAGIGATVTGAMIERIIQAVGPDFLQCDCKGHPGFSSYPTKAGCAAPGIVKDALRLWRDITARYGVSLYMHYSGVWDTEAVRRHPDWARVDETGATDANITSVFGPYVDEWMLPQFRELFDEYGVDGIWVDGDCWATAADYRPDAVEAFRAETGIAGDSIKPGGEQYGRFLTFCRERYRNYLAHYAAEVHRSCPGLEIASNWAYTSFMPEPVRAPVDFCSGDLSPQNAINAARFEARCLARHGKPWDLMSWGFSSRFPNDQSFCLKSSVQLSQEAAVVLSQGGAFQVYLTQNADGSVRLWELGAISELARFVRERQQCCQHAQPVPQIGLLLSTTSLYAELTRPFDSSTIANSKTKSRLAGILQCVLHSQFPVDILMEHATAEELRAYPLLIVPECVQMRPGMKEELIGYARGGGTLLVIGAEAARPFAHELDVEFLGETEEPRVIHHSHGDTMCGILTAHSAVKLGSRAEEFGRLYDGGDFTRPHTPAASIASIGGGTIAGVYFDLGERYLNAATAQLRDFLGSLVRRLFADPIAEVAGSHLVDVCVNRLEGKLAVNLINTAGPHADRNVYVYDEIPSIGPLTVAVRAGQRPEAIWQEPEHIEVPFDYREGIARFTVAELGIHCTLLVCPAR